MDPKKKRKGEEDDEGTLANAVADVVEAIMDIATSSDDSSSDSDCGSSDD